MHRALLAMGAGAAALAVAACGSASAANSKSGAATASPSGGAGRFAANRGASGQLVQVNDTTLVLNTASGDVTVDYTGSTPITKTSTGSLADVVQGACIVATGQKDATGSVIATNVRIAQPVNGSCAPAAFTGPRPSPSPGASPRTPNPSRSLPPGLANLSAVGGQVSGVSGTSVTVQTVNNGSQTITVPTTATVSRSDPGSASDLAVGVCVSAAGPKAASGDVTARSLNISPPGANGTCSAGRGFGGFFGGGRGGPGAGSGTTGGTGL